MRPGRAKGSDVGAREGEREGEEALLADLEQRFPISFGPSLLIGGRGFDGGEAVGLSWVCMDLVGGGGDF